MGNGNKRKLLACWLVSRMPGAVNDCSVPPSWSNFLVNVLSLTAGVVQGTLPQAYLHSVRCLTRLSWQTIWAASRMSKVAQK